MSVREMLISEIERLPEPMLEEALRLIRLTAAKSQKPVPVLASHKTDPLTSHPELAGRILYDPMEPATEEDWPSSCRCGYDQMDISDEALLLPSREVEQEVLDILDAVKEDV